ncbi:hypothetical protein [Tuberibacillus sp. Marseille-P3662]|uniref:hypothetical protein n=1 Tax=Tuberibacillus sp. Marseille-P3662 TaxID=1965358 RepID=UPI001592DC01|nr:hypothetical protein [Tuberibacillus sp. Marseille-P3662]
MFGRVPQDEVEVQQVEPEVPQDKVEVQQVKAKVPQLKINYHNDHKKGVDYKWQKIKSF